MRRIATMLAAVALCSALGFGASMTVAGAAQKPPVKIRGGVDNHGVVKASGGAASIEADDFFFDKTFVKAQAGQVTITVTNGTSTPHTFTVDDQDIDEDLAPGQEVTVTVDVDAEDPTVFYCRLHGNRGMKGAVFTKKSKAASSTPARSGSDTDTGYGY